MEFNILQDAPTIIYPNGGEIFYGGEFSIQWVEPGNVPSSEIIWYEIFIIDDYRVNSKYNFIKVAILPYGNSSFLYKINKNLKGDKFRVGIRVLNQSGQRSKISVSAKNFKITNSILPTPSLMEPLSGKSYFSQISFIFDHSAIVGRCSYRSYYQIYAKSDEREIDWFLVKGEIPVGSDPINIDTHDFISASDYKFRVELTDGENVSQSVFIDNVTLNNVNYFLIDTLPPVGKVVIQNNQEYTNQRELVLNLTAYDETTGVKEYNIKQIDIGEEEQPEPSPTIDFSEVTTWQVSSESKDGVKLIQANFKDYVGNEIGDSSYNKYFRTYKEIENSTISSFLSYNGDLYYTFSSENISEGYSSLYKNLNLLSTFQYDATSLCFYNDILYITVKDDENKGILQRYTGSLVETVKDNEDEFNDELNTDVNNLYYSDSAINTMVVFDNKLFMGLQNGRLLSFNGAIIEIENDTYENVRSISKLMTDGNVLYIYFEKNQRFLVMYKNTENDYVFTTITMSV